jgi:hypothetical protein
MEYIFSNTVSGRKRIFSKESLGFVIMQKEVVGQEGWKDCKALWKGAPR